MSKKEQLEALYEKIFSEAVEHMKDYETQMVAGTLMAIAMRLYKTHLTDEGFREMMQTVMDAEVEPYFHKYQTLHYIHHHSRIAKTRLPINTTLCGGLESSGS